MSRREVQRAVADLLRDPIFCRAVRAGRLDGYSLSAAEQARVIAVARHAGMSVAIMLYRASRLVGISRRAPEAIEALGTDFEAIFNAYLMACRDAPAEFDDEGRAFRRFAAAALGRLPVNVASSSGAEAALIFDEQLSTPRS